jgi:hypothetical protein
MAELRVFLNERGLTLPAGALVRDAIRAGSPDLLPLLARGEAFVTDGCGLPVALDAPLSGGAILRAAATARQRGAPSRPDLDASR